MPETLETGFNRYLGDGVYASYDGYQMWLSLGDHTNRVVALDDPVWDSLVRYRRDLLEKIKQEAAPAK